ncbi:MAG: DUF423 domain-containing protein [Planctomycetota bacterium]|nr:MAG: DUF423 domain-containing protein [Planctomycetota bacterium]
MYFPPSFWMISASLLGALSVTLGAFGAHGLKHRLSPEMLDIYHLAIRYCFYHIPALVAVALLSKRLEGSMILWSGFFILGGLMLFSGSLIALSLTGYKKLGIITPFGGTLLVLGWLLLAWCSREFY